MIEINGHKLNTTKPTDLDGKLIATTGHGAAEIDNLLQGGPALAASALRPFVGDEQLPGGELAAAIALDRDALAGIRKLYGKVEEKPAAPATEGAK